MCGGGWVGETHLGTLVQPLLVLLCLADAGSVALELCGAVEGREAVDAGHRGMANLIVLFQLWLLHGITAPCTPQTYCNVVQEGEVDKSEIALGAFIASRETSEEGLAHHRT